VEADDRTLIDACLAGQTAAFGEIVRRHQDRLYASVYRVVGNAEDAQDVVQEAFLLAYQSLDGFKGDALFFTWLYRIAVNAAISLKRKRKPVLSLHGTVGESTDAAPADVSAFSRPGEAMERAEEDARLIAALDRLSPEYRAVLVLKDLEGRKYEEMAELLDVPIGTVRSRLHRARLELRDLLKGEDGA
jgi:RNA polymerase sigma-70 factor (ECF subfamily)